LKIEHGTSCQAYVYILLKFLFGQGEKSMCQINRLKLYHSLLITIALTLIASLLNEYNVEASDLNKEVVVESNSAFAIDLHKQLKAKPDNIFFSPYSISTVLAVLYAGAREETARQIADVIHLSLEDKEYHSAFAEIQTNLNEIQTAGNVIFHTANSLWPQKKYPFLKEYLDLAKNVYQTEIIPVEYYTNAKAIRLRINSWAERKTNNKIQNLLPDAIPPLIHPRTTLVIVNAIYFKGAWATEFNKSDTHNVPFHLDPSKSIEVSMMHQTSEFNYGENDILQVLELPYKGNEVSMFIVLPREIDGLQHIENTLETEHMKEWSRNLYEELVAVYLPKFKITYFVKLNDVLQAMGMKEAFTLAADFSGIDGELNQIFVEFFLHKAFIDVNEEGTEAAAATAAGCFPAETEVLTDRGLRPIETVDAGTKVYACDLATGKWTLANVVERFSVLYEGDMITIQFDQDSIQATGNQPFYVRKGDRLASRPLPQDVPNEEQSTSKIGRWVEARDLKKGDIIQNKIGVELVITGLSSRQEKTQVYCLDVQRYHNCAVHRLGILAHNGTEGKKSEEPEPILFRVDHPFLFLIRDNITESILFMGRVSNPSMQ
jgi:serpin B